MMVNTRKICILPFWGYVGLIILVSCFVAPLAEAALTPQAIQGTVEVLRGGEQTWAPLTASTTLQEGDQIKTSPGGSVELWLEDGSVLSLGEDTKLSMKELELSTVQKTRVARLKLWWGAVTAKITKLGFTESVCEIETNTVVAGIKFSEMKVEARRETSQTHVTALQGMIEVLKTAEGDVQISGMLDEDAGIQFPLDQIGAKASLSVQKIVRKITLEVDAPVDMLRTMLGKDDNTLKIDNPNLASLEATYTGIVAILEQDRAATFGIPDPATPLMMRGDSLNFSLWFKARTIQYKDFYVFADKGPIYINGQTIETGTFNYFSIEGEQRSRGLAPEEPASRTLTDEQDVEEPVVPPAPESQTAEGAQESTPTPEPTMPPPQTPTPASPIDF